MDRTYHAACLCLWLALPVSSPAFAQPAEPEAGEDSASADRDDAWSEDAEPSPDQSPTSQPAPEVSPERARADKVYSQGRYDQALAMYTETYEKTADPSLLARVGDCHIRLHHYLDGIDALEKYLRLLPEAEDRQLTEDLIQEAVDALNRARLAVQEAELREVREQQLEYEQKLNRRLRERLALQAALGEKTLFERWWFWTAVGAVAVGAAIAATVVSTRDPRSAPPAGELGTVDAR